MQTKTPFYFAVIIAVITTVLFANYFVRYKNIERELARIKKEAKEEQTSASVQSADENSKKEKRKDAEKIFKELSETKKKLKEKENEIEKLKVALAQETGVSQTNTSKREERQRDNNEGPPWRGNFQERMERLRTENPERFQQIREHLNQMTQRIESGANEQQEFLSSLDTSKMSEAELENHKKIEEIVKRNSEIAALLNQDPDSPDAEMMRSEMFSNFRELRELFDTERDYALRQFAHSLGYTDNGAETFTEYINYIMRMTSMRSYFPGPPGWVGGGNERRENRW